MDKKIWMALLTPFILGIFFSACEEGVNDVPNPVFSGYTSTDVNGVVIGPKDFSDWVHEPNWTTVERELFDNYASLTVSEVGDSSILVPAGFPNPVTDTFIFVCLEDAQTSLSLRLVNQDFDLLWMQDGVSDTLYTSVNMTNSIGYGGNLVRLYYMFVRHDTIVFQGHGDILIE